MNTLFAKASSATIALLIAGSAAAEIGGASVDDVHLDGNPADAMAYAAGWNPHAGPQGNTSGFGTTFDSYGSMDPWDLLAKYDGGASAMTTGDLTFTFAQATGTNGTWTVTNTGGSALTLDLVFALHAGNQGVGWLFDDQTIAAGQTLNGDWVIEWTVGNGGASPDFSNMTVFGRDLATTPVPEPATYGMLLAGLMTVGALGWRRQRK